MASNVQTAPPPDLAAFRAAIQARFATLSDRLQRVARHVLDEPHDIAFETLAVIAARCASQPSAIVRFAQAFGFDGASQMQRLVRDGLLSDGGEIGYEERIRQFRHGIAAGTSNSRLLLSHFVEGNMLALENLYHAMPPDTLDAALALMAAARVIFVAGYRRAFPPAALLAYLLAQGGHRAVLIDGVAGLHRQQAQAIGPDDLVVAVSFAPYSPETADVVQAAATIGCATLAITDSVLSPIAEQASVTLLVKETEVHGFRSLSATTCLVQTLAIGLAAQAGSGRPG